MIKLFDLFCVVTLSAVIVECVPSSILVDMKGAQHVQKQPAEFSIKVKRTSDLGLADTKPKHKPISANLHASVGNLNINQQKFGVHKRGVDAEMAPVNYADDFIVRPNPIQYGGIWNDVQDAFNDPGEMETDDGMNPTFNNNLRGIKSYEILQNLLNSRMYAEPAAVALPMDYSYPTRYYSNRIKRSSGSRFQQNHKQQQQQRTMHRRKRDIQLSPTDVLALLHLLEAEQREQARNRFQNHNQFNIPLDNNRGDSGEWLDNEVQPSVQFYSGQPKNMPAGKMLYNDPYASNFNQFNSKRFMASKQKRGATNTHNWFNDPEYTSSTSNLDYGRISAVPESKPSIHKSM